MRSKIFSAFIILCLVSALSGSKLFAQGVCTEPVQTQQGSYVGAKDPEFESCVYKGIPFAEPPLGKLRFARPVPASPHQGVKEAVKFGPACPQVPDITMGGKAESYSEDCLYLNVWRPAREGVFPVMVWIHGGGFTGGSGSFDIYNGANLSAREELVIVTINYRLGALGFLALPELKEEDKNQSTGNMGILDQILALEWVRDNIENFGGDPNNVTVFGQSAGAMSICALLASPEASGLFQKAMMMSGPCGLMTELEDAYKKSRAFAESIGCEGPGILECLRSKPTSAFVKKSRNDMLAGGTQWAPTVDQSLLPDMPLKLIQNGKYNKVPVIIGTTRDELRSYALAIPGLGLWPRAFVNKLMKLLTGENAKEIMSMYDYREFRRPIDLAFAFANQMTFDTPAFIIAQSIAAENPVYWYRFDWDRTRMPHKVGAMHAIDVPFVFGAIHAESALMKLLASKKIVQKATPLSYTMMSYVANFARKGDPNNGDALPEWPAYSLEKKERLYFDEKITVRPLSELELKRYGWYAERSFEEIMSGKLSRSIGSRSR